MTGAGARFRAAIFILGLLFCSPAVFGSDLTPANIQAAAEYSAARRGLSLLVIQHGRVVFQSYPNGQAASEAHKIYSGTKGFWILAGLCAVQEGWLVLDERVSDTIGEWRDDAGKSQITVRQLLNFGSGIDAENRLHGSGFSNRDAIALRVAQVARPGEAFIYGPAPMQIFHEVLKRKLAPRGETPKTYLERKVLRPLGLGPQRYLEDAAGNPLLAAGFALTAWQWAKVGELILNGGSPVVSSGPLSQCFRGSAVNPAFGLGFWNNRLAGNSSAREFDLEDMLQKKWQQQDWRATCICRAAPADLIASIGSGYQRLFVVPSLELIVVRQGIDAKFSDGAFLRALLGR